jgi:tetratricopeptide (TPR) repeat protein
MTDAAARSARLDCDRPSAAAYAAVFAIALALRALYQWQLRDSLLFTELFGDGQQYDEWARRIAAGDWIGGEVFYQAPLYPYFLAVVYTLADQSLAVVRALQALLGAASCALLLHAGSSWFSRRAGLCAALLLVVHPPAIFFDGLVQKSSLDLFLVTGMLALLGAFAARQRAGLLAVLGVVLGLLTLNRENARVAYAIVAPWLWLGFRSVSALRRLGWIAALLAASACVLAPVAWRNQRIGGEWLVSTSQLGPNLWIGNHPGASGLYEPLVTGRGDARAERADATRLAEEASGRTLGPGEVSDYWTRRALAFAAAEPLEWARLTAWKAFLTFHAGELADSESIDVFASRSWLLRALHRVFGFGLLVPLAVIGIWWTRAEWRRLALLYVLIAGFAASVALFFVFARYRYPLVPILALFAGPALAAAPDLVRSLRSGTRLRESGVALGLAAAVAVAASWPLPQYRDDEITWYNLGLTLLERAGRVEDAARSLEEAVRIEPAFALARYQLGRAYAQQGRLDVAEQELARAVQLDPALPDAHYGYATLVLRRDPASADGLRSLRRTIELAPSFAAARTDLAWLLATHPDPRLRNGPEALAVLAPLLATPAGDAPQVLDTASAIYAEVGRHDEALALATRAIDAARAAGDEALARRLEERRAAASGRGPGVARGAKDLDHLR